MYSKSKSRWPSRVGDKDDFNPTISILFTKLETRKANRMAFLAHSGEQEH